jgi:hypothetical protein
MCRARCGGTPVASSHAAPRSMRPCSHPAAHIPSGFCTGISLLPAAREPHSRYQRRSHRSTSRSASSHSPTRLTSHFRTIRRSLTGPLARMTPNVGSGASSDFGTHSELLARSRFGNSQREHAGIHSASIQTKYPAATEHRGGRTSLTGRFGRLRKGARGRHQSAARDRIGRQRDRLLVGCSRLVETSGTSKQVRTSRPQRLEAQSAAVL